MSGARILIGVLVAAVWVYGCGEQEVAAPPEPPRPTRITVTPSTVSLMAIGATSKLTAVVWDQVGNPLPGVSVDWSTTDPSTVTVDATGLVKAVGVPAADSAASVSVRASVGSVMGVVAVSVRQRVDTIVVTPSAPILLEGTVLQMVAEASDANGYPIPDAHASWASSDTSVAFVSDSGLATGVRPGKAEITATAGGVVGRAQLSVGSSPDRAALVALYEATNGPGWYRQDNWLTNAPVNEWYGVTVDSTARVVEIRLWRNQLAGSIPAELGNLDGLKFLSLGRNELKGGIPPEIGELAELTYLGLGENQLTGSLPPELYTLTALTSLGLWDNAFEGSISPDIAKLSHLETLRMERNAFAGPIPAELGLLTGLRLLTLGSPEHIGPVPSDLGNLTNLERLEFDFTGGTSNASVGPIPPRFGNLTQLRELRLRGGFAGPIPKELERLGKLTMLRINYASVDGSIPPELGNLASLQTLDLSRNGINGSIPPELGNLVSLQELHLRDNWMPGTIPPELGKLANLTTLNLRDNTLSGSIPAALGALTNLRYLDLGSSEGVGNVLTGAIPQELGNLLNLTSLDLSYNHLTGSLPEEVMRLEKLRNFTFYGNHGLCAPGTQPFVEWSVAIHGFNGPFCNDVDHVVLSTFHETMGGAGWKNAENWIDGRVLADWYGVTADSLGRVTELDLSENGLAGELPANLDSLAELRVLDVSNNAIVGRLPITLTRVPLHTLRYFGTELCAPPTPTFTRWLDGIGTHRGTGIECPPMRQREILTAFYHATNGSNWRRSDNWLTDAPVGEWYGVQVDSAGQIVQLYLSGNSLRGTIPGELGDLRTLQRLSLEENYLSGALPPELGALTNLTRLDMHSAGRFSGAIPPEIGDLSNLQKLDLTANHLTGPIPPELGNIADLRSLYLSDNALSGSIPPELGQLQLTRLWLHSNKLTGPIPPTLGDLANLWELFLNENDLTGIIPPQFGRLAHLTQLWLHDNRLSGPIPPELGNLGRLSRLNLYGNKLSGPLPEEFGFLTNLSRLNLAGNAGLVGRLPMSLTNLHSLRTLLADRTELCVPEESSLRSWLENLATWRIALCRNAENRAYLVQSVQSFGFPDRVPLVAGEEALLRVFVTARRGSIATMPSARARFHVNGVERYVVDIPASQQAIPETINEGELSGSINAAIPAVVVQPGLEMVIDVDPDNTLDPALGVATRIPQEGRLTVEVVEMPEMMLTLVPLLWEPDPDSSLVDIVAEMAGNPEGNDRLKDTRTLLPVGRLSVRAHSPVMTTSTGYGDLVREISAVKQLDGVDGYHMGIMSHVGGGAAWVQGRTGVAWPDSYVIAHELGHNMNLSHAPCGSFDVLDGPDPDYPYSDGSVGAVGYDRSGGGRIIPSATRDLMSYCDPRWISDYHFTKALRHRLATESESAATRGPSVSTTSLLIWGGIDGAGRPYLSPTFVVDAPPALPDRSGDYTITGRTFVGTELFSFAFSMPVIAGAEEESSFVFVVPTRPAWAGALASIRLSGPSGTVTLDGDSDLPMVIIRDRRSGQVRAILRDVAHLEAAHAEAGEVLGFSTDDGQVHFSRGIPGPTAWRR